jgi:hypothetical protein
MHQNRYSRNEICLELFSGERELLRVRASTISKHSANPIQFALIWFMATLIMHTTNPSSISTLNIMRICSTSASLVGSTASMVMGVPSRKSSWMGRTDWSCKSVSGLAMWPYALDIRARRWERGKGWWCGFFDRFSQQGIVAGGKS